MVRNWCNSRFKDKTTEYLMDLYGQPSRGELSGFSFVMLRVDIGDEVYARFNEHMNQIGMHDFMVDVEERWQRLRAERQKRMEKGRTLVKRLHFGIPAE